VRVSVLCPAKLNLFLKVYGKRPDGYHNLISVMQSIDLVDSLSIEETESGKIEVSCTNPDVPCDESNLAYRAADYFFKKVNRDVEGLKIHIEKNIPRMGGLAGGSTDAAGVLVGLREITKAHLEDADLVRFASEIGSDVPFCVIGGTILVQGRGEMLEPLPTGLNRTSGAFLVILPPVDVDTPWAYDMLDESRATQARKWEEMGEEYQSVREIWMSAIMDGSFPLLFHNDFAEPLYTAKPELGAVYENMRNAAGQAILSGSGSAMFAWFSDVSEAIRKRDEYTPIAGEIPLIAYPMAKGVELQ
jgi:4-diphosphocytidyl-2-C-methyl-D-erythritol kinase